MKKRLFNIMQYEKNPVTGEDLGFNLSRIQLALKHKVFKKWCYIRHDSDVYCEDEENIGKKAGDIKPPHWHVVIRCDSSIEINDVARFFHIPVNYINIPKGRGDNAFYDCIEYLTHEHQNAQSVGKHLYDDKEVSSNFQWRKELSQYQERRANHQRKTKSDKSFVEHEVAFHGMSIYRALKDYPEVFMIPKELNQITQFRGFYLTSQKPPANRVNIYISGGGGIGKGVLSEALARIFFPDLDDEECFFHVGSQSVNFDGYDGQPVIIWDDFRSKELTAGRSKGELFKLLEPFPKKERQNIKYASIQLLNQVNIINSVQPWSEFLDGLAAEYTTLRGIHSEAEDKNQSYRRFQVVIPMEESYFDILFNKGYLNHTNDWQQYEIFKRFKVKMRKVIEYSKGDKEIEKKIELELLQPLQDKMQGFIKNYPEFTITEKEQYIKEFKNQYHYTIMDGECIENSKIESNLQNDLNYEKLNNFTIYEDCLLFECSLYEGTYYEQKHLTVLPNEKLEEITKTGYYMDENEKKLYKIVPSITWWEQREQEAEKENAEKLKYYKLYKNAQQYDELEFSK